METSIDVGFEIDDETVQLAKEAVSRNSSNAQLDTKFTNLILLQLDLTNPEMKEERTSSVVRVLIAYTWTQRLYFIIRSALMGIMGAVITAIIVQILGTVNSTQVIIIGNASFIVTLVITRLFDVPITQSSGLFVRSLSRRKRLRVFILNHF